ncbi:hypothetical protein INT48_006481 [Thamnidium elegans]|uniref:Uncharacterized protein n=1 Tax=Thamnidium elegans TaxID=101142 RepID=A0A8H7SQZ2_9FUNG|nr:hypothetical protein INT48_006481 [Thamnidium elegans]
MNNFFDLGNLNNCTFEKYIEILDPETLEDVNNAKLQYCLELDKISLSDIGETERKAIGRLRKEAKKKKQKIESSVPTASTSSTQKIISSDNDLLYRVESEEDIWNLWYNFVKECKNNDNMHSFSLEKIGIIQCGYTVKMRSCFIPELYPLLVVKPTIIDPCKNLNEKLIDVFESETINNFKSSLKRFKKENVENEEAVFISKIFKLLINGSMDEKKLKLINKRESNLSYYLIWPLMEAVSSKVSFEVGEYKLVAIHNEIIRRNDDILKNLNYNADDCHTCHINKKYIELSLLEISSKFSEKNEAKFTKDHVKAGFGALAILQEIGHIFCFGSLETFSSILVYFVHVMGDKIRLWSLELVSAGVCVMDLIHTATIPTEVDDEVNLRELVRLLWTFRHGLELTMEKVNQLFREHKAVELSLAMEKSDVNEVSRNSIPSSFEKGCILKIKGDYIPGYEELQV